jgi:hypothetical protein
LQGWVQVLLNEDLLFRAVVGQVGGHKANGVPPPPDGYHQQAALLLCLHQLCLHLHQAAVVEITTYQYRHAS